MNRVKCETCLNSRLVVSENGDHWFCTLPPIDAVNCMTGIEDDYVPISEGGLTSD